MLLSILSRGSRLMLRMSAVAGEKH